MLLLLEVDAYRTEGELKLIIECIQMADGILRGGDTLVLLGMEIYQNFLEASLYQILCTMPSMATIMKKRIPCSSTAYVCMPRTRQKSMVKELETE
ncbi:hypothetical protein CFP56_029676 [Quercus suber]|uniref:Uncharacterized protein n=1 Tax=Quercus suber TaxID=58331 RepID=A0AAW0JQK8_QUESU